MIILTIFNFETWKYNTINAFDNNKTDKKLYNECLNEFLRLDYC
jgi:hypothetical protein